MRGMQHEVLRPISLVRLANVARKLRALLKQSGYQSEAVGELPRVAAVALDSDVIEMVAPGPPPLRAHRGSHREHPQGGAREPGERPEVGT